MLNENTKFSFTIGKMVAILISIVGLSFTIGMSYQTLLPDRKLQEQQTQEIQDIKITLAKVSTILENMQEKQNATTHDMQEIQNKSHIMNAEIQVISSYVKEGNRKRN